MTTGNAAVEAIVFDWGGTLTRFHNVDLADGWRVAAQALAPERVDEVAEALLEAERAVWARTQTTMRSATTAQVLRSASRAVGMDVDAALHDAALTSYLEWWTPTTTARPEAREVLEALRARGLRTGLLSNTHWPREQHERWLVRDGIADLLDVRVYTSDLAHVKPHREAFAAVLAELDVDPERTAFVGDRLWDDIEGASRLGMKTIWVRNLVVPAYEVAPDEVVDDLGEVVGIVDEWLAGG